MTILITGASGLLGRCLIELLESMKIKYIATYNTRQIANGYKVNFEDENEVGNFLKDNKITSCINCIVQRQVDVCENNWEEIKRININLVDILSRQCCKYSIYFIHISTDYVFDGKAPPHYPTTEVNPLQNYGISKLISEKRVMSNMDSLMYTIIRVPVLYSDNIENLSENAVTVIGKKVLNQIEATSEDDYSIRRPIFIPDFCKFIVSFINNPERGIFHYYNPVDISTKYNTANLIAAYLGKSAAHIKPNRGGGNMANRPYDTELKDDKYDINKYHITNLKEGIEKCFKKWKHPNIMEKSNDVFIMLDLDGTILNTDITHYNAYFKALQEYNIELTWDQFDKCINYSLIDNLIVSYGLNLDEVKSKKLKYMLNDTKIEFMEGADIIINKLIENDINFVIVTNTSYAIIEHYMNCLPLLRKIKKWVCREDYVNAKPSSDCYQVALDKFYKNEKYRIGFENTMNGFNALENMVDCVYFITTTVSSNYNKIKKEDIYLINDFKHFL